MKTTIRCYSLFDITHTGIQNKKTPVNILPEKIEEWVIHRNQQSNLDTLIQVISLRTQPEDVTKPVMKPVNFSEFDQFGFLFENEEAQHCWTFEFSIYYNNAYNDGISELGGLYSDCEGVPMIKVGTEWSKLPSFLDTSPELKNIHFEVLNNE